MNSRANVLLDGLDKELEKRGLRFVRYADDFLVFTKSEAASKWAQMAAKVRDGVAE